MSELKLVRIDSVKQRSSEIPLILLCGRDKGGSLYKFQTPFIPHFYVDANEIKEEHHRIAFIRKIGGSFKSLDGHTTTQIDVNVTNVKSLSDTMDMLRKLFKHTYESHILLTLRYMIDKNIMSSFDSETLKGVEATFDVPHRVWYLDIETKSPPDEWVDVKNPIQPITMISLYDNYTNRVYSLIWHPTFKNGTIVKKAKVKVTKGPNPGIHEFDVAITTCTSEIGMLLSFVHLLELLDPDILTGWFSSGQLEGRKRVGGFDYPYIMARMSMLGLNYKSLSPIGQAYLTPEGVATIKGRVLFDLHPAYKKIQKPTKELKSWSLSFVAEYELGIKSPERKPFAGELWEKSPMKMLEHNVLDVIKTYLIDKYKPVISAFDDRKKVVGCSLDDVMHNSKFIHTAILRQAKKMNIVVPDKLEVDTENITSYTGGLVGEPPIGIFEYVINLDFKLAYPNAMRFFNISPETCCEDGEIIIDAELSDDNDNIIKRKVRFRRSPRGIFPMMLDDLIKKRLEAKKKVEEATDKRTKDALWTQDRSLKFAINSSYGVIGHSWYPLYNPFAAASITAVVRDLVVYCAKKCEEQKKNSIYNDTDGIYVRTYAKSKEECIQIGYFLTEILNQALKEYIRDTWGANEAIEVEFVTAYLPILFLPKKKQSKKKEGEDEGAKKRLIGGIFWKDGKYYSDAEIKGVITSTSSDLAEDLQNDVIKVILSDWINPKAKIGHLIEKALREIRIAPIERIGVPTGISSPLYSYEDPTKVVEGAIYSNNNFHTNMQKGDKPMYLYVKGVKGYPPTNVISFRREDLPLIPVDRLIIDYERMIDHTLRNKVETILEALGTSWLNMGFPIYKPTRKLKPWEAIKSRMQKQKIMEHYLFGDVKK